MSLRSIHKNIRAMLIFVAGLIVLIFPMFSFGYGCDVERVYAVLGGLAVLLFSSRPLVIHLTSRTDLFSNSASLYVNKDGPSPFLLLYGQTAFYDDIHGGCIYEAVNDDHQNGLKVKFWQRKPYSAKESSRETFVPVQDSK